MVKQYDKFVSQLTESLKPYERQAIQAALVMLLELIEDKAQNMREVKKI